MGKQADMRRVMLLILGVSLVMNSCALVLSVSFHFWPMISACLFVLPITIVGAVLAATVDVTHMKVQDDRTKSDKQVLGLVLITIGGAFLFFAIYAFYYVEFVF